MPVTGRYRLEAVPWLLTAWGLQLKTSLDGSVPTLQIQAWQVSGQSQKASGAPVRSAQGARIAMLLEASCWVDPAERMQTQMRRRWATM
mmetsp:Transcript_60640/g.144515  ORF Transcript_60640/g.144515 Transcript_60640/m.144515 type:complete len:89 (-) Transcript_60640:1070-1336(-)